MHLQDAIKLAFSGRPIAHKDFSNPARFIMYIPKGDLTVLMDSEPELPTSWDALSAIYGSQGWLIHKMAEQLMRGTLKAEDPSSDKFLDHNYLSDQIEDLQASLDEVIPILDRLLELAEKQK